jgi:hypothetical protein
LFTAVLSQEERLKVKGASVHTVTSAQYGTYNSAYLPEDETNQVVAIREMMEKG